MYQWVTENKPTATPRAQETLGTRVSSSDNS